MVHAITAAEVAFGSNRFLSAPDCSSPGFSVQDLAALSMIGMAAVLALCEHAAGPAGGFSPQAIAQRLRQVACSGGATAQHLIRQLGARRLPVPEIDARFPFFRALGARAGLTPPPDIYLYRGAMANAFALGDRAASVILVSEDLLARLDAREMSAVLAHEIRHNLNGDARVLALAAALEQMIVDAVTQAMLAEAHMPASGRVAAARPSPILLLFVVAPAIATMLRHGLSRTREYDADRLAAGVVWRPLWRLLALGAAGSRSYPA